MILYNPQVIHEIRQDLASLAVCTACNPSVLNRAVQSEFHFPKNRETGQALITSGEPVATRSREVQTFATTLPALAYFKFRFLNRPLNVQYLTNGGAPGFLRDAVDKLVELLSRWHGADAS